MMRPRIIALAALLLSSTTANGATPPTHPVRFIVGVDRSASRTAQQLSDMRGFLLALVETIDFGDELSILQIPRQGEAQFRERRDSIPATRYPGRAMQRELLVRTAMRTSFQNTARRFTDSTGIGAIQTTDIIAFLRRASEYARSGAQKPTIVIVLSDMLNSTQALDMERNGGIPGAPWIASQKKASLLPELAGVCVVASGAEWGTARAVALKRFWQGYLSAAGAMIRDANYRAAMAPADIDCR